MILCVSVLSVVISPFSFLILLIWFLFLCFLMSLANGLSILFILSKNQLLALLIFAMVSLFGSCFYLLNYSMSFCPPSLLSAHLLCAMPGASPAPSHRSPTAIPGDCYPPISQTRKLRLNQGLVQFSSVAQSCPIPALIRNCINYSFCQTISHSPLLLVKDDVPWDRGKAKNPGWPSGTFLTTVENRTLLSVLWC